MNGLVAALLLASARLWALLRVQASWAAALGRRWTWICAGLALVLASVALSTGRLAGVADSSLRWFALALGFELLLGAVLGLAVSLPGWALVGAADESARALALRGPAALAPLLICASLAAGLGLGLHRPLLAGLLASFELFSLARPRAWLPPDAAASWLIERAGAATILALALATPVLLTRAVIELGLASLARAGFTVAEPIAALGSGLRLAAALVALGAAWSAYPQAFAAGL